jgi:hypothetical protein
MLLSAGSCTYSQRLQAHVVLLDTSRMLRPINETIGRCMSRPPLLKLSQWSALGGGKVGGAQPEVDSHAH